MRGAAAALAACLIAGAAPAGTLRVASYNVALSREAPGILLKDLRAGDDPQIAAVARVIRAVRPDILVLNEVDYDGGLAALEALRGVLAEGPEGISYPHAFAWPSNTGVPSGLDLDGDGTTAGRGDAFGFGGFPGQYGMAVLSVGPIDAAESHAFRKLRWADLPWAHMPRNAEGGPFPSAEAQAAMRLSSKAHWDLAVETPAGPLRLLVSHPTPPVFDGPEDLNGWRNNDEIMFWVRYLDGARVPTDAGGESALADGVPFVLLGDMNADPLDGDGRREAVQALLAHPALRDPLPRSAGGLAAAEAQGGPNAAQAGDPALDTADWPEDAGPGNLRVDYVLPSAGLEVADAGVYWPAPGAAGHAAATEASDHRLVWVDIVLP